MALTPSVCLELKLWCIMKTGGEAVLSYALHCGTDGKLNNVHLDDYLRNLPQDSTANFNKIIQNDVKEQRKNKNAAPLDMPAVYNKHIKKQFNKTDFNQIRKDPSCTSFDITLLHKAIKVVAENVAEMNHPKWTTQSSELEYLVYSIKDLRNKVAHEKSAMNESDYLKEVTKLKDLFSKALTATKDRYNRDDSELMQKMAEVQDVFDAISKEHVGREEILKRCASDLLPYLKEEANKEIKDRLQSAKSINPLRFLAGYEDVEVDVHGIFSKIVIKKESNVKKITDEERSDKNTTDHLKLLTLIQSGRSPSLPHILIVEGDAGSGKTTLLTFLLAEWLKEESQRSMEGLQEYDVLLYVVCRHESGTTLESLVERSLPNAFFKYRDLLLPLLKHCKILFIIDGLDEKTESSSKLVEDIMSHGQQCPTFTVVCTSRPEGLEGMRAKMPQNFKVFHTVLEGISIEERTNFVERHITHLNKGGPIDTARLRQVMQQIGWRELFRLPLNLLFLSFMFVEDPDKLSTRITQTVLYQDIVRWTEQKLRSRAEAKGRTLEGINEIKEKIHEASLQTLLQDTVYLREEDLKILKSTCGENYKDVLSSFFCLRREVVRCVPIEKHCAPHKGLQEYFAAHHIAGRLDMHKQEDIRHVLEGYLHGQPLKLPRLRNLLSQLLGILSSEENPKTMAMEETVDLIHESGVKKTDDWLTLLADIDGHQSARARIAHHIGTRARTTRDTLAAITYDDSVTITDGTVHVAADLLPLISRKTITIQLKMEPIGVKDVLCPALTNHTVKRLILWHHYKQPHQTTTSTDLLQHCPRSELQWFAGHLGGEHLSMLPRGLEGLRLKVADDEHARELLPRLRQVRDNCPRLRYLCVHVPASKVTAASLAPLPDVSWVYLTLSGVGAGELHSACAILAAMCPKERGYYTISFPGLSLGSSGGEALLRAMAAAGVRMLRRVDAGWPGWVGLPDTAITSEEEEQLDTLAETLLGCGLLRAPEDDLW